MKKLLCLLMGALMLLLACNAKKNQSQAVPKLPDPTTSEDKIIERTIIERDTLFQTKADSTFYNAWIECQNGIPILKNPQLTKTTTGKIDVAVSLIGNQLNIKATKEAEELFAKWKQEFVKELNITKTNIPYAVEVPVTVPRELSKSEKLWIKTGQISALALLIFILIKVPWSHLRKLLPF